MKLICEASWSRSFSWSGTFVASPKAIPESCRPEKMLRLSRSQHQLQHNGGNNNRKNACRKFQRKFFVAEKKAYCMIYKKKNQGASEPLIKMVTSTVSTLSKGELPLRQRCPPCHIHVIIHRLHNSAVLELHGTLCPDAEPSSRSSLPQLQARLFRKNQNPLTDLSKELFSIPF